MRSRRNVIAWVILAAAASLVSARGTLGQPPVGAKVSRSGSGPTAIAMDRPPFALVLQADGRLIQLDTASATLGTEAFRIPQGYGAVDMAAAIQGTGSIVCLTLNQRSSSSFASFVLQLMPDRREVWTWLPVPGVYVGVAIDVRAGFAYAVNSSNNAIYRIRLGEEKSPVAEIARIDEAERLGALAIDVDGGRLFVAESSYGRMYVVPLPGTGSPGSRAVTLAGAQEVRALAWHAAARRLFIADSGREAIWSLDPAKPSQIARLSDPRLREPAGLTVAPGGNIWVVDEGSRAAFEALPGLNAIVRAVNWDLTKGQPRRDD